MSEAITVSEKKREKFSTRDIVYIALFSVIIAVCSWISIPMTVPFTMQTFAVFAALCMLGGKKGTISVMVYIFLGAVGIPVFAEFSAGFGVLLGTTGGYIVGFIFSGLIYWLITSIFGNKLVPVIIALALGLLVCYAFGTIWFMVIYAKNTGPIGLMTALGWCVFPFIIPDILKIALAVVISRRLSKHVKI